MLSVVRHIAAIDWATMRCCSLRLISSRDYGKAFPVGITRFGEQFFGPVNVVFQQLRFVHHRLLSGHRFRQKLSGGFGCAAEIVAADAFAIDREREGFAHAHVVKWFARGVEGVVGEGAESRAAKIFVWREQFYGQWLEWQRL